MRSLIHIISAFCLFLASGCTSYHQVEISVLNLDGDPVVGASVHAAPLYLFNPTGTDYLFLKANDIIYPFPSKGDAGVTDIEGLVTLDIVVDNPLMLNVYAEGFSTWQGQIALSKQKTVHIQKFVSGTTLVVSEH